MRLLRSVGLVINMELPYLFRGTTCPVTDQYVYLFHSDVEQGDVQRLLPRLLPGIICGGNV